MTIDTRRWWFRKFAARVAALTGARIPAAAEAGVLGCFWHATQMGEMGVLAAGAPMLSERDNRDNEVMSSGSSRFYRRLVVQDNRLSPRDRDLLGDDLDRLRGFRTSHSDHGEP